MTPVASYAPYAPVGCRRRSRLLLFRVVRSVLNGVVGIQL